ncbi:hypothetical protein C8Q74DRAFT_1230740 [Fomes fomentarius]|nr:hypothetical protein C8Q74DRAFT_1230740 [Fomes fomentarius]
MGLSDLSNGRRLPPTKRRKIVHPDSTVVSSPVLSIPYSPRGLMCVSCHRAFAGAKQNQLIQCDRCHAPTCAICSRTCNGCPPSTPPTPVLTSSPSLPDTPLVSPFPALRRPVLAMNTNTALGPTPPPIAGRRRKARDREEEEGGKADGLLAETEEGVLPGCGRTVCRNCATESTQSELITCYDCAGRSSAAP